MHPVAWTGYLGVRNSGADPFTANDALYAQMPHQTLYGTARHGYPFTVQLPPHLIGTIDLQVFLPDPLNLW